jgi:16S rRNA (uracil1498-N3)-methyltransferase
MKRILVENITPSVDRLSISGGEARYINKVLRMKRGQELIIMDGRGQSFKAIIERVSYGEVTVKIDRSLPPQPSSPVEITLCQALLKSHAMDYLIQKVTELGITAIQPFLSERTVIRIRPENRNPKLERWREVVKSACRQCNRAILPLVEPPRPFSEVVENAPGKRALKVLLWENEASVDLKGVLRSVDPFPHVFAVVGPEGGLTPKEVGLAMERNFRVISLGNRILRAETAAVSLISIIQYEWGDLHLSSETVIS